MTGGLFVLYGLLVGVTGLNDAPAEIKKAQGVRINLWAGAAALALGLFLLWQWLRRHLHYGFLPLRTSVGNDVGQGGLRPWVPGP